MLEQALGVRLVQHGDGFVVAQAREGRLDRLQFRDVALDHLEVGHAALEHAADDEAEEVFGQRHQVIEAGIGELRLDHPELGEVAAGLGFFRAEGGAEAVDLAEGERGALDVELAALGEEGLVAEVVHREERRGAFARGGREDRRIGEDEAVVVEIVAGGLDDLRADAQDGGLARRANPEMAMLHQEIDAVLLGRDGIGLLLGHALHHFDVLDIELVAAGGALVGADAAGDDDAGLLGEVLCGLPDFRRDGGLGHDALHGARAIAKDGEEQLAGGAHVVEPAVQDDGLAFMLLQAGDGGGDGWLRAGRGYRCVRHVRACS